MQNAGSNMHMHICIFQFSDHNLFSIIIYNMTDGDFSLGKPVTEKAVKALLLHSDNKSPVYLQVTVKKPLASSRDYNPRLIPLKHRIKKASEHIICLIVRDPHAPYKKALDDPSSPTHKVFEEIVGVRKLKSKLSSKKALQEFENTYDLILAEKEVLRILPRFLPSSFYKSGKLRPIPVEVAKRKSIQDKRSIDAEFVKAEVKRVTKCGTMAIVPGTCLSVRIGTSDMKESDLVENIDNAVRYIGERVIPRKWSNIQMFNVKTPDSAALPLLEGGTEKD